MQDPWKYRGITLLSHTHEAVREASGWEDPKESKARIGLRTTGIQQGQRDDR